MSDLSSTFGAMLLGGYFAVCLSGILTVQTFIYHKLYSGDSMGTKSMVGAVWSLDTLHTGFVCASGWYYLIGHFGDAPGINIIPWNVAITVAITAAITLLVHCFFVYRIYKLTNNSWLFAGPIAVMAFLRLVAACVSTGEMIRIKTFEGFSSEVGWVFTLGLSLSSAADICITAVLCYKLKTTRMMSPSMNKVLDSLVVYTIETGVLTSAATVASMICWVTMPQNKVFLAIHVAIAKLYANSLLATILTRNRLRDMRRSAGQQILPLVCGDFESVKSPNGNRLQFATNSLGDGPDVRSSLARRPTDIRITVLQEQQTVFDEDIKQPSSAGSISTGLPAMSHA